MRILRFFSVLAVVVCLLSVSAFASEPVILSQPQNYYFPSNVEFPATAYFSVLASGDNLTYQWQRSKDNGVIWLDRTEPSASTMTFTPDIYRSDNNGATIYRCVISNSEGNVISSTASVSVGAFTLGTIPQMLASGTDVIESIFVWIGSASASIIGTPLLLIGVSFFALGASISIISRLLSRS